MALEKAMMAKTYRATYYLHVLKFKKINKLYFKQISAALLTLLLKY